MEFINEEKNNVRPKQAAELLGLSISTLAKMRMRKEGPLYLKLGRRVIAYRMADLHEWMNKSRVLTEDPSTPGRL